MYRLLYFIFTTIIVFLIAGCKTKQDKEPVVSEGIVNYEISYAPDIKNRSFSFLLPDEMRYYFRPGQERISFKGNMGLYMLDFISNHNNDSSVALLKILKNKMYVPSSESQNLFIFDNLKQGEVVFHEDTTRTILGYDANKASIEFNSNDKSEIVIWYTQQITNESANKNTPFSKIPGVMLEFAIYYNNILFNLKSVEVQKANHADSVFEIPNDYRQTSIREIEQMVLAIIN